MMYTSYKTELGKLRAYYRELTDRYVDLLRRRQFDEARPVQERRRRVRRTILLMEEFELDAVPAA